MSRTREATNDVVRRGMWRSRWAAVGAAIAVSLGAGGLFVAQAAPGPSESTIVTVTPERILDTRDPNNVGLAGPFVSAVSQKLQVTGSIPTATGTKTVVPTGATGVLLNVTPVNPTANGFISIRPGDATGAATTSSLNFTTGVAGILPNAVQVAVPTAGANAGEIDITYDAYGQAGPTTDILIDVVGYMTSAGLQELVADVATKADAADVYTKAQVDAGFVPQGEIVMRHNATDMQEGGNASPTIKRYSTYTDFLIGAGAPDGAYGTGCAQNLGRRGLRAQDGRVLRRAPPLQLSWMRSKSLAMTPTYSPPTTRIARLLAATPSRSTTTLRMDSSSSCCSEAEAGRSG